jgi:acyl-CoA reductase-like NAD-dependent aldehyde dehydrogenase
MEVVRSAMALEYFAAAGLQPSGATLPSTRPGVSLWTRRDPVGPVLLITPFNFPLFVTALKLGPALVAGNSVIWKPSPHTPLTSVALLDALIDSGLPDGVVNLVFGGTAQLGVALIEQSAIQAISFTGSTAVGLEIGQRASRRHVRVQQEMGGKNALIVTPDCDLEIAAKIACEATFGESGQKCTATGIVFVFKEVSDTFLSHVDSIIGRFVVGNGADPGVDIGPLIEQGAVSKANRLIDESLAAGGTRVIVGGKQTCDLAQGHFMLPTVIRLPQKECSLASEETFAPVMPVQVMTGGLDEVMAIVDKSDYGLSASILTDRLNVAMSFIDRAPVGMVSVNLPTTGVEYQAPFGGWHLSGGPFPEAGPSALDFYSRNKTIAIASQAESV